MGKGDMALFFRVFKLMMVAVTADLVPSVIFKYFKYFS